MLDIHNTYEYDYDQRGTNRDSKGDSNCDFHCYLCEEDIIKFEDFLHVLSFSDGKPTVCNKVTIKMNKFFFRFKLKMIYLKEFYRIVFDKYHQILYQKNVKFHMYMYLNFKIVF